MLFKTLFRNPSLLAIVIISLLLFAILPLIFFIDIDVRQVHLPFFVIEDIFKGPIWYLLCIGLLIHAFVALLLIGISSELKLLGNNSLQIPLVYLLLLNVLKTSLLFSPALLSLLLILLALRLLLQFQVRHSIHSPLLLSNAMLVFAGLIYPPAFVFLIPAFIALITFRSFSFREFLIFFIGVALPFFYYYGILFLIDRLSEAPNLQIISYIAFTEDLFSSFSRIGLAFYAVISLVSFITIFSNSFNMVVRIRNFYKVWAFFAITALSTILIPNVSLSSTFSVLMPFITLALCYFISKMRRSWYLETLMFLLVLFSFIWEFMT